MQQSMETGSDDRIYWPPSPVGQYPDDDALDDVLGAAARFDGTVYHALYVKLHARGVVGVHRRGAIVDSFLARRGIPKPSALTELRGMPRHAKLVLGFLIPSVICMLICTLTEVLLIMFPSFVNSKRFTPSEIRGIAGFLHDIQPVVRFMMVVSSLLGLATASSKAPALSLTVLLILGPYACLVGSNVIYDTIPHMSRSGQTVAFGAIAVLVVVLISGADKLCSIMFSMYLRCREALRQ